MGKDRDKNVTVRYYKEQTSKGSACVRIAKATMVPVNTVRMIPSKIRESLRAEQGSRAFLFYPLEVEDGSLEIADLVMDKVTKHLRIPVFNNTNKDIIFEKGDIIGFVKPIKEETTTSIPTAKVDTCETDGKLEHLDGEIIREVEQMIIDYKQICEQSKKKGIELDIKHHITLKDHTPVSAPPRRIPYSQREDVKKQIDTLLEQAIIEESHSAFGAPIVIPRHTRQNSTVLIRSIFILIWHTI